jgi:hypothetical protein
VRVVDEGLLIGGKREVELTRVGSELSADLLGAWSGFRCLSVGRRVRFFDRGIVAFSVLKGEVAGCSKRNVGAARNSAFELCASHFDGVEVGTVRGKYRRLRRPRLSDAMDLCGQIVHVTISPCRNSAMSACST